MSPTAMIRVGAIVWLAAVGCKPGIHAAATAPDAASSSDGDDLGLPVASGGDGDGGAVLARDGGTPGCSSPALPNGTCVAALAATTFARGMCVCQSASVRALTSNGDVALNGSLNPSGPVSITGALIAVGDLTTGQPTTVAGDLHLGGQYSASSGQRVTHNAYVGGGVRVSPGGLEVDGDLYTPAATAPTGVVVKGAYHSAPVTVTPPCACDDKSRIDIATLVADAQAHNDDASGNIDRGALAHGGDIALALGCGRFYVDAGSVGHLTLTIAGRAALFLHGTLTANAISVALASGGELDLIVDGSLDVAGGLALSNASDAGAVRVYVAGAAPLPSQHIAASVYAPLASVGQGGDDLTIDGALVGASIDARDVVVTHAPVPNASCQ